MISWDDLKKRRDIVWAIEWDLTPQAVFEAYQIKSPGAGRHRDLEDVFLPIIYVHQDRARVLVVKRTYKDTEEIAEAPVPADLLARCLDAQAGRPPAGGQYPLDEAVKAWMKSELGV